MPCPLRASSRLPHAIAVTTADVTDRQGALAAFRQHKKSSGRPFAEGINEIPGAAVQIAKRNEFNTSAVVPQQWVVEWSFAWLEKCPRFWKNGEWQLNTSLQFVNLAFLALLLRSN